jgi:2-oxoadipate dioxygenase/decarboxylase
MNDNLAVLLASVRDARAIDALMRLMHVPALFSRGEPGVVTRAELAQALNMALFADLLERVPTGRAYTDDVARTGGRVTFDHGALRTVRWPSCGALPPGEAAFTRILRPLGYRLNGTYPLDRLKMTGRSYAHLDAPDQIAQYFVSELHPERFSGAFQQAATRVLDSSADPLTPHAVATLAELERDAWLPLADACALLPVLVRCFARQHATPRLSDYETLRAESAEMAWIATEGNAFNHATDRVADVDAVADAQRALGRPIKAVVEVSKSGRVRQTAFRADPVLRAFVDAAGARVEREVPGSFYEFITRDQVEDGATGRTTLDLGFDAGNATGIFKMTAAA